MEANTMQDLWTRFETWLEVNAPMVLETLQPGATEEQFAQVEKMLSIELPEDFKAVYRIHNGQINDNEGFLYGREMLSLERIQNEWKVWKELLDTGEFDGIKSEPTTTIRDDWWNARWIPITWDGAGNHHCLDLDPTTENAMGQIIDFWHDDPTRSVEAGSFGSWISDYLEKCEAGKYVYSESYAGIVSREDAELDE